MRIELCMGSSCFARGNARLLQELEDYIETHGQKGIELSGHLCLGDCSHGPNIRIGGKLYHGLSIDDVKALIEGEE